VFTLHQKPCKPELLHAAEAALQLACCCLHKVVLTPPHRLESLLFATVNAHAGSATYDACSAPHACSSTDQRGSKAPCRHSNLTCAGAVGSVPSGNCCEKGNGMLPTLAACLEACCLCLQQRFAFIWMCKQLCTQAICYYCCCYLHYARRKKVAAQSLASIMAPSQESASSAGSIHHCCLFKEPVSLLEHKQLEAECCTAAALKAIAVTPLRSCHGCSSAAQLPWLLLR
jgi:hypothetical protein